MKYFSMVVVLVLTIILVSSCNEKLQTEFGVSKVYFGFSSYKWQLKGIDTLALPSIISRQDTTLMVVGVYRSGVVDNLQEIVVKLSIDSVYLDSIITKAQTASALEITDLMKTYKNSKALGQSFFSIPSTVTIPQGERRAIVPITVKRSLIELYKNNIFNYNSNDLTSTSVPKDKMLILPLKIDATSCLPILETQNRYYFQITKWGNLK